MTTEQLLAADLTAMRLALTDLAKTLSADQRGEWLSNLHRRIARIEKTADLDAAEPTPELKALANALESLHMSLSRD